MGSMEVDDGGSGRTKWIPQGDGVFECPCGVVYMREWRPSEITRHDRRKGRGTTHRRFFRARDSEGGLWLYKAPPCTRKEK